MGKNRFAKAEVKRLDLSDGDWIEIKTELTFREEQQLAMAGVRTRTHVDATSPAVDIDWDVVDIERLFVRLVDWSFRDERDKPVPITRDSIGALTGETTREIHAAIDAYLASPQGSENPTEKTS